MEMEKYYEQFKEILDEQIKKIAKKGDITPQELENVYKASAIVLDFETQKAMKKAEEQQKKGGQSEQSQQGGQSQQSMAMGGQSMGRQGSYAYGMGGSNAGGSNAMGGGSNAGGSNAMGGQSNHYPWFMYGEGMMSNAGNSGNSYGPVWNQGMENKSMHEVQSQDSMASGEGGMSTRRGVKGTGRGRSRDSSYARSYEGAYEGAYAGAYDGSYEGSYDGSYEGSYEGSMDASNDNSYRRGRSQRTGRYTSRESRESRGYSRAMDKERMIGKLEDMMDDAPSEKERRALEQCVEKLQR